MRLLLIISIVVLAAAISPEPIPTCSRPDSVERIFPISVNEVQTFNVNDIFKGYNLNYTLVGAPDFVYLR